VSRIASISAFKGEVDLGIYRYIVVFKDGVTEADITKYADEVVASGGYSQ